ncbi:MAG: peptidoglycan-binding protein [Myxococcota bacterium]
MNVVKSLRSVVDTGAKLHRGDAGQRVKAAEQALKRLGRNPGAVDGRFDQDTFEAVKKFQRANGMKATGRVGAPTAKKLLAKLGHPYEGAKKSVDLFVSKALDQKGDRYVFGAETNLKDKNPGVFDCSELVQWAAAQAGINLVDGSQNQRAACKSISVEQALRTRGALLFTDGHVAISLGNGKTIEARGRDYGVGVFSAYGRGWEEGGLIPGMKY